MSHILCLACSSSLPGTSSAPYQHGHLTTCCNRIICETCITNTPRLKQYDPCLSCLAGTSAVSSAEVYIKRGLKVGEVQEEDVFVVGDEDDDAADSAASDPPVSVTKSVSNDTFRELEEDHLLSAGSEKRGDPIRNADIPPSIYWIKSKDTLTGIALKYGVDARALCRLNNLPPSTLNMTPHILHTRTTLILPPNLRRPLSPPPADEQERLERRERESATKRLQFVTKEVDYSIARAYVSLADIDDPEILAHKKDGGQSSNLKGRAVDMYLEDEDWEREERMSGRGPQLLGFPYFNKVKSEFQDKRSGEKGWWSGIW